MKKYLLPLLSTLVFFTSCTSAATEAPTATPVGSVANAVETINTFYTLINDAQTENDLIQPWQMLTPETQCNPRDQCQLFMFTDRHWPNKVLYKLYDCGQNSVVAEEMQYPRDADASATGDAQYWKYQVIETEDGMKISGIRKAQVPGNDCVLVTN